MTEDNEQKDMNPKLLAVVRIRHFVSGLRKDWSEIEEISELIQVDLKEMQSQFEDREPAYDISLQFDKKLLGLRENAKSLRNLLASVREKIAKRDSIDLTTTWEKYHDYSDAIARRFDLLEELGDSVTPENELDHWTKLWNRLRRKHEQINQIAEACHVQLSMIEQLAPEEVDQLTNAILTAIPHSYSVTDASQYESEYVQAWEDIRRETQQNNLWDKFLTILAGGVTESPAQRVMMQRWLNGEKGEL